MSASKERSWPKTLPNPFVNDDDGKKKKDILLLRLAILDKDWKQVGPLLTKVEEALIKRYLGDWWVDLSQWEIFLRRKKIIDEMSFQDSHRQFELTYRCVRNEFEDWGNGGWYTKVVNQIKRFSKSLIQLSVDISQKEKTVSYEIKNEVASQGSRNFKKCAICFNGICSHALIPCGHVYSCEKCALVQTSCAICRQPKKGTLRIYLC